MYDNDFSDLLPGDRVYISTRYGRAYSEGVVERLTKTQIVVRVTERIERRFRMDGYQVGSGPENDRLIRYEDARARRYFLVETVLRSSHVLSEALDKFRRDVEEGSLDNIRKAMKALSAADSRLRDDQKTSDSSENS